MEVMGYGVRHLAFCLDLVTTTWVMGLGSGHMDMCSSDGVKG